MLRCKLGNLLLALQHDTIRQDHESIGRFLGQACEEITDLLYAVGRHPAEINPELPRHLPGCGNLPVHPRMNRVTHEDDLLGVWNSCPKQIETLHVHLNRHEADACQVPGGTSHAAREVGRDRVPAKAIHDRNIGDLSDAEDRGTLGDDHIGVKANHLINDSRQPFPIAIR
jgi:hypothetical protein